VTITKSKNILSFCFALLSVTLIAQKTFAQTNDIPWRNNLKAGHYIQAGDAKIYYEMYGKGALVFPFAYQLQASNLEVLPTRCRQSPE
jgi:hypothetical protein